eukprot:1954384-Amphidinium_carterae.1
MEGLAWQHGLFQIVDVFLALGLVCSDGCNRHVLVDVGNNRIKYDNMFKPQLMVTLPFPP